MTSAREDRTSPEILPEPASTYHLLLDAARAWPDGVATQWIPDAAAYTRSLTWTYADLTLMVTRVANARWEPAARPKRVFPIEAIPVTAIGKHFKPVLAADAAVRAAAEALAHAGLPAAQVTAAPEDGPLVITVTGADPGRVREALAGFPLTIRTLP